MNIWHERALAFAGMAQTAHLVGNMARTGMVSQDAMEGWLASVFVTSPGQTLDVYPYRSGLRSALQLSSTLLDRFNRGNGDVVQLIFALMQLSRRLTGDPGALRELGAQIECVDEKRLRNEVSADDVAGLLADTYEDILGRFPPRIMVHGDQGHLTNPVNVMRIRAMLLAGIRSAVLFFQLGGRPWHLVFRRGRLKSATLELGRWLDQSPELET